MSEKKFKRTVQCAKCPWKVATDPFEIPDGYCEMKHEGLKSTIADPNDPVGNFLRSQSSGEFHIMACHHSKPEQEEHCVGWLINQLTVGNNIYLRLMVRDYVNAGELRTVGEQHECFEDTLPQNKKVSDES